MSEAEYRAPSPWNILPRGMRPSAAAEITGAASRPGEDLYKIVKDSAKTAAANEVLKVKESKYDEDYAGIEPTALNYLAKMLDEDAGKNTKTPGASRVERMLGKSKKRSESYDLALFDEDDEHFIDFAKLREERY